MDLITLNLKQAFPEPGCPVCRLRDEHEERFLMALLQENILDLGVRKQLSHSQGLCHPHAWRLQAIEQQHWNRGLGVAILYEDLVTRVADALADYLGSSGRDWRRIGKRAGSLASRLLPRTARHSLLARLTPVTRCLACDSAHDAEKALLSTLARNISNAEFRGWYGASDGLCLPHLRRAIGLAEDDNSIRLLLEDAEARLELMLADVREYVRKQDWHYREEVRLASEQAAWVRSVAFVVGEAPKQEPDQVYWLREKARTSHRLKPGGNVVAGQKTSHPKEDPE